MKNFGDKSKSDYEKTKDVIMSCKTPEQLKVGVRMYNQLNKMHSLSESDLDKLENLIGLMRIKCGLESIEESTTDIDKTSKNHTTTGGITELSKIKFSEDEKTPETIAKKHNVSVKDIEKEIKVGTKIEMKHSDSEKEAKKIALDHISEIHDFYTDPQFGVIAIEKKQGEGRKTIRISKKDMDTLHKKGKISLDGIELTFPVEEEIGEATGADSSGSFVGAGGTISRTFRKSDFPISKSRLNKPVEKVIKYNGETPMILDEEELDEATGASGSGQYATAGFPPSKFMGTLGKKGKTPVKKTQPDNSNLGYTKVRVKEKCKTFPYCNQSPEAIETYSESRVIKTFNKSDLKLKNNNII